MHFEPIAIIGHACLLPGINSPDELWRASLEQRDCITDVPPNRWIIDPAVLLDHNYPEQSVTNRGGYVCGFHDLFDPNGFAVPADEILPLGAVFQWPLHLARAACQQTRYDYRDLGQFQAGAIFANLSYPTPELTGLTLHTWLQRQAPALAGLFPNAPAWRNRFMSGLPAQFLARAFNLNGIAYTLDAACGSAIYALSLACTELHTRRADLMFAGGINAIDEIFVHMGFSAAHALSKHGSSLPFDQHADGLVASQGGGMFLLKRLDDAIRDQDAILGVIRGIGVSNDGHSAGLLVPSVKGQVLAMQQAYDKAGIDPSSISYVECHATGTLVGDALEIHSMQHVFKANTQLTLGALKSNIGHTLTASTSASLHRVLCAFAQQQLPPIRRLDNPIDDLKKSQFTVPLQPLPWQDAHGPLRAAVNGFGMGGTNAHLIIERYEPTANHTQICLPAPVARGELPAIGIIAIETLVGASDGVEQLTQHLFRGQSLLSAQPSGEPAARIDTIELPIKLPFPPNDLKEALGQQLAVLHTGLNLIHKIQKQPSKEKIGIFMGMGCDPEIARRCLRWILPGLLAKHGITVSQDWLRQVLDGIAHPGTAAHMLGAMPNVIASRLAVQWDCQGPAFAVCGEELSGIHALQIAIDALQAGDIDMAIVGAADLSCETVHQLAAQAVLPAVKQHAGDAAVLLALKRLDDAHADQERVYSVLATQPSTTAAAYVIDETRFIPWVGHAHAASGLLHLALAALACYHRLLPQLEKKFPLPWYPIDNTCCAQVTVHALGGQQQTLYLNPEPQSQHAPFLLHKPPRVFRFRGDSRAAVLRALRDHDTTQSGTATLTVVADDAAQLVQKQALAEQMLTSAAPHPSLPHVGLYYRDHPIDGKVAFVFASSNTAYADMGIDLVLAYPQLVTQIQQRYPDIQSVLNRIYTQPFTANNFLEESSAVGFLSWLHYLFTREVLGIQPDMVFGHSNGESNALTALGVFQDQPQMELFVKKTGLFAHQLDGEYLALRHYHPDLPDADIDWENWRLGADALAVKAALADDPHCHLTIINTPQDCVIGGLPRACKAFLERFQPKTYAKLKTHFMVHCPEVHAVAPEWYQLHHRRVDSRALQFYSCITAQPYPLNSDAIAAHMLKIGTEHVDFPQVVNTVWEDGARVFIEHGPQGLCSQWIKHNLGQKEHLALHLDQPGRPALTQAAHVVAALLAAGVEVNYSAFSSLGDAHVGS